MNRVERSLTAARKRLEDQEFMLEHKLMDVKEGIKRIDQAMGALKGNKDSGGTG